jgi:hypothetical protein
MMIMQEIVAIASLYVVLPTACFLVLSMFEGFPRIKLRQIAGIVVVAALVFAGFSVGSGGEFLVIVILVVVPLLIFFGLWRREFRHLMLRSDEDFPGRFDKLGWFLMLTFGAPAGVWLYRSFRKTRWPESVVAAESKKRSSPWDDEEMDVALSPMGTAVE